MLPVTYLAAALLFGACVYALYVSWKIHFAHDVSYIKDGDGSALEMPHLGKYKFAALYGVFGACGISLLLLDFLTQSALSRWIAITGGFAGAFSGARWFVIQSHKKAIKKSCEGSN